MMWIYSITDEGLWKLEAEKQQVKCAVSCNVVDNSCADIG